MSFKINNPWIPITERPECEGYAGLSYEIRHIPTGKVKRYSSLPFTSNIETHLHSFFVPEVGIWSDSRSFSENQAAYKAAVRENTRPTSEWEIRVTPSIVAKIEKVSGLVQAGDFVRFSGSGSYKWRKIASITKNGKSAYGQCALKPGDRFLAPYSSENSLSTVVEIIRDGAKIYPAAK